jgi:hypothetical protein
MSTNKNKSSWLSVIFHKFITSFWQIYSYFMCLLFSLLFMKNDVILGLNIFFGMSLVLTCYYFIWKLLFFIFKRKK